MVDHRIALRVIGARSIAVSAVFLVQGKYVDAIPAFLRAYGMAVGGGHDRADSPELAFMYLQARKGMASEMERKLNQIGEPDNESE